MALALYRKYRPRTFAEVIGQDHVTVPLQQALASGRLHHAYLFSGPRGCGKTSSARILARSLNCEQGPTPAPCGTCQSCLALAPDGPGSIDVVEIDAASHGSVDEARGLRERAMFAPMVSRFKVYVIDEAHMVTTQGFNALLKLVEEPPNFVVFVFATTEPDKVLTTIRSRTHHYPFRLIPPSILRPYLEDLCRKEGVAVEPAVFPLVVRAGGGSVRDTLSVLDQLIAGAGDAGVTYARAVALLGVTDIALIDEMVDALAAGDGASAFAVVNRVAEAGHDPRRFTSDLLERLRDLILLRCVPDAATSGIIDAPADQMERMESQAARMGQATLSRLADIAHSGLTDMRGTTAPRLVLELIVARMLLPAADDSHSALLQRMEWMERRLELGAPAPTVEPAAARPAATPPATAPAAVAPPAARPGAARPAGSAQSPATVPPAARPASPAPGARTAIDAAAIRQVWGEVLNITNRRSKRVAAFARDCTVRDVDGDTVVLLCKASPHARALRDDPDPLTDALHEVLGGKWRIRTEVAGQPSQRPPSPGPARAETTQPAGARPTAAEPDPDWPTPVVPGGGGSTPAPSPSSRETARPQRARTTAARSAGSAPASRAAPRGESRAATPAVTAPTSGPKADASSRLSDEDSDYETVDSSDGELDPAEDPVIRALSEQFAAERIGGTDGAS